MIDVIASEKFLDCGKKIFRRNRIFLTSVNLVIQIACTYVAFMIDVLVMVFKHGTEKINRIYFMTLLINLILRSNEVLPIDFDFLYML